MFLESFPENCYLLLHVEVVSPSSVTVLGLTGRSLIHSDLIFMQDQRDESGFIISDEDTLCTPHHLYSIGHNRN